MQRDKHGFQRHLETKLKNAKNDGLSSIVVKAGDLHELVLGKPSSINRTSSCCCAMRRVMKESHEVLPNSLKKNGLTFRIRYNLQIFGDPSLEMNADSIH